MMMTTTQKHVHTSPPSRLSDKRPVYTHLIAYENSYPHRHMFIEFFYVFDGSCAHKLNGEVSNIRTGDAFFLIPSDVHEFYEQNNSNFLHRDILFTLEYFKQACEFFYPTLFDDILNGKYNLHFPLSIEQINRIENLTPHLNPSLQNSNYELIAKALSSLIITIIIENNLPKVNPYPAWLTTLLTRMHNYENLSVDLSKLISEFAYSKEYLRRSFKKHIGVTMTEYFNKQKMHYAYSQLLSTNYSIERICESIGITNIAYFYQLFKKHFGITPHSVRDHKDLS